MNLDDATSLFSFEEVLEQFKVPGIILLLLSPTFLVLIIIIIVRSIIRKRKAQQKQSSNNSTSKSTSTSAQTSTSKQEYTQVQNQNSSITYDDAMLSLADIPSISAVQKTECSSNGVLTFDNNGRLRGKK